MIDRKFHITVAGLYCVAALLISVMSSAFWGISFGFALFVWLVLVILFSAMHGVFIGRIFFKRNEEVLLDVEDSNTHLQAEMMNMTSSLESFSTVIDSIVTQQEEVTERITDLSAHHEGLEKKITEISEKTETAISDIEKISHNQSHLQQRLHDQPHSIVSPPKVAEEAIEEKNQDDFILDLEEDSDFLQLNQDEEQQIQDLNSVSLSLPPQIEEGTAQKEKAAHDRVQRQIEEWATVDVDDVSQMPAQGVKVKNVVLEKNPETKERFAESKLPDFLGQAEDNLDQEDFINGLEEEFADFTPQLEQKSFEDEEFTDVTDTLQKNNPDQKIKANDEFKSEVIDRLLEEEFVTDQAEDIIPKEHKIEDRTLKDDLFEEEFIESEAEPPKRQEKPQNKSVKAPSPRISAPVAPKIADKKEKKEAALPSLSELIPKETKIKESYKNKLKPSPSALPSLDSLTSTPDKDQPVEPKPETEQVPEQPAIDAPVNAPEKSSVANLSDAIEQMPAMQQKDMDHSMQDAIEKLQIEANKPQDDLPAQDLPQAEPVIEPQAEPKPEPVTEMPPPAPPVEAPKAEPVSPPVSKNNIDIATELPQDILDTVRYALENNLIETVIQPVVDSVSQNMTFLDASNYIQAQNGLYHPPIHYMQEAARADLDKTIDQILLTRAVQTVRAYDQRSRQMGIFANVSVKSITEEGFIEELLDMAREKQDLSHNIILSLSQNQMSYMTSMRIEGLTRLAAAGFGLALGQINDNLPELQEIVPIGFKYLRITPAMLDQGIVVGGRAIGGQNLKRLCQDIGLKLVIETVNTHNDMLIVMNNGADYIQGDLFAPLTKLSQFDIDKN
ncbi:MAG: EAL domain-containing protein [Pseudomonadota bacterium]